jgi:hypothetical protein
MSRLERTRHSRQAVALCLAFASVMAISYYAVPPVFSQLYVTVTRFQTYTTIGFTTSTSFLTYVVVEPSSSPSTLTYTSVLFTTSTSLLTYVTIVYTSSTTFFTQPAPGDTVIPASLTSADYFSTMLYAFLIVWVGVRSRAFYDKALHVVRRISAR